MKITTRLNTILSAILAASILTACSTQDLQIPAVTETTIAETADSLNVSVSDFETYLDNINMSYDDYIQNLNNSNMSVETLKSEIEEKYDCSFNDYMTTIITVNNKILPDENYRLFQSEYSIFDAFIPVNELNDNKLTNYDATIIIADNADDALVFDLLVLYSGNTCSYLDYMYNTYGCNSVEFTNLAIYGSYGVTKPTQTNSCMDSLFAYDENTNEILEPLTLSMATLHFNEPNKNITLALSNELGLIFKTTGVDSEEKMLQLSNLNFQIRNNQLNKER